MNEERTIAFVIKNPEELKNPVLCYTVMRQWEYEAGESFVDYNENIVKGNDILDWLLNKNYITKEKHISVIEKEETHLGDLLFGFETGVMQFGECCFPATNKSYQLLAEYISENEELRKKLFEETCINSEDNTTHTDDNGNVISACILDYDLETNTMTKEEWLKQKWRADISFADEYKYLYNMTIEEADYDVDSNEE